MKEKGVSKRWVRNRKESKGERLRKEVKEIEREAGERSPQQPSAISSQKEVALVSRSLWEFLSSSLCLQPASFQLQASPQLDGLQKNERSPFFRSFFPQAVSSAHTPLLSDNTKASCGCVCVFRLRNVMNRKD